MWPGLHPETYWPPAAETKACGSGKVRVVSDRVSGLKKYYEC